MVFSLNKKDPATRHAKKKILKISQTNSLCWNSVVIKFYIYSLQTASL